MKKTLALTLLLCGITLASCGGEKQDLKNQRRVPIESIDADIKENLKLTFDNEHNSTKLYADSRDSDSYYDIFISNNYKQDLFISEVSLKNANGEYIVTDRTKEIHANTLRFKLPEPNEKNKPAPDHYSDELSNIMSEAYNDKYGIPSLKFDFEISKDKGYSKIAYQMNEGYLYDAIKAETDEVKLQIIYMPIYAVRTYNKEQIYKNYYFLPIQYYFVCGDKQIKPTPKSEKSYELIAKEHSNISVANILFDNVDGTKILYKADQNKAPEAAE